jgi:hypothetical protein
MPQQRRTEREGFEPSNEVSPVTRFPVAPVQPLRHLSGCSYAGRVAGAGRLSLRHRGVAWLGRVRGVLVATSEAFVKTFGLIVTFGGIGLIVNILLIFIAIQIRGERRQNQAYRESRRPPRI